MAVEKGARVIPDRVESICWVEGKPEFSAKKGLPQIYHFVTGAVGVNTNALKIVEGLHFSYTAPETSRTYICELPLGEDLVQQYVGNAMHVFLLDLPGLEFAALIPKGEHATAVLLGEGINKDLVKRFLETPEVRRCMPPDWVVPKVFCHCAPLINTQGSSVPYMDRLVLIGDSGTTRLYKDVIGAAYRTAKAVESTALLEGISAVDFKRHYLPIYNGLSTDNRIGKLVFAITQQIQSLGIGRHTIMHMAAREQWKGSEKQRMSTVLWDTFTGSAPYKQIFLSTLHPMFMLLFTRHLLSVLISKISPKRIWSKYPWKTSGIPLQQG